MNNATFNLDLLRLPLDAEHQPEPLLATEAHENDATISPDGRWMAYRFNEPGRRPEVYVSDFPNLTGTWQISTEGGQEPVWSRDGRELFFRVGRRTGDIGEFKLMAVKVSLGAGFQRSSPKLLFQGVFRGGGRANYDSTPDGKRFLIVQPVERRNPPEFRVVLNWFEELRSRTSSQVTR